MNEASCMLCRQKVYILSLNDGALPVTVDTKQRSLYMSNRQRVFGYELHIHTCRVLNNECDTNHKRI